MHEWTDMMNNVSSIITTEENDVMSVDPTGEKVGRVVLELSGDSASGPDDFTRLFFSITRILLGRMSQD